MSESRTNMRRGHGPMRGMGATEKAKISKERSVNYLHILAVIRSEL